MKAASIYVALVGLPIVLLVGLLRAGRALEAPPAVGGKWAGGGATVRIQQSGRYAEVQLVRPGAPPASLRGRVGQGELVVPVPAWPGCPGGDLHLRFGGGDRPRVAVASLEAGTPECGMGPLPLRRSER